MNITLYVEKDGDKTWTDPNTGHVYQLYKAPAFDATVKTHNGEPINSISWFRTTFQWDLVKRGVQI